MWYATSQNVAGIYPFGVGTAAPVTGAPLGRDRHSGSAVAMDHHSLYMEGVISSPSCMLFGINGVGKALDVDTLIPTPDGYERMGDLQVGDYVLGSDGRPVPIVWTSEVMSNRDCYAVSFSTGEKIVADADHLWTTDTFLDRSRKHKIDSGKIRAHIGTDREREQAGALVASAIRGQLISQPAAIRAMGLTGNRAGLLRRHVARSGLTKTRQGAVVFVDEQELWSTFTVHLERERNGHRVQSVVDGGTYTTSHIAQTLKYCGVSNHAVLVAPALQFPEAELPMHPYALGAWLGDGSSAGAAFTTADREIITELERSGIAATHYNTANGYHWGLRFSRHPRGYRGPDGFIGVLRELKVLGNKSIPTQYLRASEQQRRDLLAGLLDTDGWAGPHGSAIFTSTSPQLAADVHELICSLGYRASISESVAKLDGREIGPKWDIVFTPDRPVFRLSRKNTLVASRAITDDDARRRYRYITDAEPVKSRPVRCIQIANDDGLFLVGRSMIATHNSTTAQTIVLGQMGRGMVPAVWNPLKRGEHTPLVERAGGRVFELGPTSLHRLNLLSMGPLGRAADRIGGITGEELRELAVSKVAEQVKVVLQVSRRSPLSDIEEHIVEILVDDVLSRTRRPRTADLLGAFEAPSEGVMARTGFALVDEFHERHRQLGETIRALLGGDLGRMLSGDESMEIDPGNRGGFCFDTSSIPSTSTRLLSSAMLLSWSIGMDAIDAHWELAKHEAEQAAAAATAGEVYKPQVVWTGYTTLMDEFWYPIRSTPGIVDRADALSRANRSVGTAEMKVTHSPKDMLSLPNQEDREKARGLAERSGLLALMALTRGDLDELADVKPLTSREIDEVSRFNATSAWARPAVVNRPGQPAAAPPGAGKVLFKVEGRPGISVQMVQTEVQKALHITDTRFRTQHQNTFERRSA